MPQWLYVLTFVLVLGATLGIVGIAMLFAVFALSPWVGQNPPGMVT